MAVEIVMPRMGLNMEQGTVIRWIKAEGERVTAGEDLFEIETDKTNVLIQAPASGTLSQVLARPGDTLPIGSVIGYLVSENETARAAGPDEPRRKELLTQSKSAPVDSNPHESDRPKASPAARHLARQLSVDLTQVQGTGPGGRVVAWNVEAATAAKAEPAAKLEPALEPEREVEPEGEPVSRVHRVMAERMAASFGSAPHFYLHVQVDARPLKALRESLTGPVEARSGVHLTFTDFLVKFAALALMRHPQARAQWVGNGLRHPGQINIGVAVETPGGLYVPVVRQPEKLGLVDIARWRQDAAERAQAGKLNPQDLEEGVFTISNLGKYRVDWFEAILNPPQAAILAVGRIAERALVEGGQVVAAATLHLSLSVDHRVLDGATAARFLEDLVQLIETPGLALA